jgi:O-antigen/teichoic acid export membrane protein
VITESKKILGKIGIDGAIFFTIITRIIQAGGGIISVVFIAKFLSPNEQGYYYTFASILAIQVFFELGLSGIITQYAAYEFAHLKWENGYELHGTDYYKSRLSSLLRFCVKWFAIIAVFLFFLLLIAGFVFFHKYNKGLNVEWQKPWVILCLTTSLNFFIDPLLAFFDGIGHVKNMSKIRLIQKTVNLFLLFIFFLLGFKLYSAALASVIAIIINYLQILLTNRIIFLKVIWKSKAEWVINYYKEIFPFQWRIALSWISGYFVFQLFNPVLFARDGPVVAGQMGMTMQALNGITAITMSWITTKVPVFSNYIAKKEFNMLDKLFNKTVYLITAINGLLITLFIAIVWILKSYGLIFSNRFLPLVPTMILCISCFMNQFIFYWATYLRCHKREPYLIISIVTGSLTAISTFVIGRMYGVNGITGGYLFICACITIPWAYYIYRTSKRIWHLT